MSQAKHTPGPWRAGYASERERKEFMIVRAEEVDGQPYIAICRPAAEIDDHEANALLIAAAPELLAALEEITQDALELPITEHNVITQPTIDKALAAIAKATKGS